jgi:hypothetical protein
VPGRLSDPDYYGLRVCQLWLVSNVLRLVVRCKAPFHQRQQAAVAG